MTTCNRAPFCPKSWYWHQLPQTLIQYFSVNPSHINILANRGLWDKQRSHKHFSLICHWSRHINIPSLIFFAQTVIITLLQGWLTLLTICKWSHNFWKKCMNKCTKSFWSWGSAPDPAGGAYDAPPDPLIGRGFAPSALALYYWYLYMLQRRHLLLLQ